MSVRLQIKVVPGATREGVERLGDALKVKVRAAPERGKANAAVVQLLAQALEVPPAAVSIRAGFGSARKTVEIAGLDATALEEKLARLFTT